MIKALIVEDEIRNADVLQRLLAKYCANIEVLAVAATVEAAVEAIKRLNPTLVFLDVELPDGTGFNVLEHFTDKAFSVIFITAYEHYAIKAIKASAIDYLLKPVDIDDLVAAVNKVSGENPDLLKRRETLLQNHHSTSLLQKIAVPTTEGLLFINQQDIILCTAEGNYTSLKLANNEKILVSKPLAHFEELLDSGQFCRTHQSHLVNINYIKKYVRGRGGYLVLNDGSTVEVSVRMKSEFLERFSK